MAIHEAIFASVCPPTGNTALGAGSVVLLDAVTGNALSSFKPSSAAARSVEVVNTHGGSGGLLFTAQDGKAILNVWNFQKDQVQVKTVLPEKMTCITVDKNGTWLAGGTASGRIYLWEVASGILFNVWDAHYRKVTVLRFSAEGACLFSGSEDAGVSVWTVASLVDNDRQNESPQSWCTLSDHTLPITDIAVGAGAFPRLRVFTCSVDHTVKAWDLATKTLLSTFHLPSSLSHVVVDPSERMIFAASTSGTGEIYQINLFQPRENPLSSHDDMEMEYEALGGGGRGSIIRIEADSGSTRRKRVFDVGAPVTAMTLNLTCSNLLVGTSTGQIQVFDITSHQHVRTFAPTTSTASNGPTFAITHLHTCLRPSDLIGHVALNAGGASGKEVDHLPIPRYVAPFQRTRDAKARETHEVWVNLPRASRHTPALDYTDQDMLSDLAFFHPRAAVFHAGTASSLEDTPVSSAKVKELEEEVQRLKEQLGKAKGVNDRMWEVVVKKVVADARAGENTHVQDDDQEQRTRKRGRK